MFGLHDMGLSSSDPTGLSDGFPVSCSGGSIKGRKRIGTSHGFPVRVHGLGTNCCYRACKEARWILFSGNWKAVVPGEECGLDEAIP